MGGAARNRLFGTELNEVVYGLRGFNTLFGFEGDDTIFTDLSKAEVARGVDGADVFQFDGLRGDPATNNFSPRTNIQDFEIGVDRLEIDGEIASSFSTQFGASTGIVLENGLNILLEGVLFDDLDLNDLS